MKCIDLTGQTFGAWTVIEKCKPIKGVSTKWVCRCKCGREVEVFGTSLKQGLSTSCGCERKQKISEKVKTHGMTNTRLYRIWAGLKARCYNPKKDNYKWYGGKGVKMCDEWKNSFEAFSTWAISQGYTDELTIDRIDSSGNYEPSNCRWISIKEQQNNRHDNIIITFEGKTQTLSKWAEEKGINRVTLWNRIFNYKWDLEKAMNTKVINKTHNGNYKNTCKMFAEIAGGRR